MSELNTLKLNALKACFVDILREHGYVHRPELFQLSSGKWSHDYIDGKRALANGNDLRLAAEAVLAVAENACVSFDAVGGPTMGADSIAHAVALLSGRRWFSVRKERKIHGKQQLIEGATLQPEMDVLLVDDVVTFGTSIGKALDAIEEVGAHVVMAVALMDRGTRTAAIMRSRDILYQSLATYRDFDIEPVDGEGGELVWQR